MRKVPAAGTVRPTDPNELAEPGLGRPWRIARWLLLAATLAITIAGSVVTMVTGSDALSASMPLWWMLSGVTVMFRRPWHPVGWWLVLIGLSLVSTGWGGSALESLQQRRPDLLAWFAWTSTWAGAAVYTSVAGLLMDFPDGRAGLNRGGARVRMVLLGSMLVGMAGSMASDTVGGPGTGFARSPNPTVLALIPQATVEGGVLVYFGVIASCVVWMFKRRSKANPAQRNRYTLVLYGFSMLTVSLLVGIGLYDTIGDPAWLPAFAMWFIVPGVFAYAVIRKGLYGIDQLVRRTVTYGLVGSIVGTVYAIPVILASRLLGETSDLAIAASTLAAAAVFNPVRRRTQRLVDQRFNRSHYDTEVEVGWLGSILRDNVDMETLVEATVAVTGRTLQPATSALWVKGPS